MLLQIVCRVSIAALLWACAASGDDTKAPAGAAQAPLQSAPTGLSQPGIDCGVRVIRDARFTTCEVDRERLDLLRIAAAPRPRDRSWTIASLDSTVRARGNQLVAAMNAGIFGEDGRPLGLLIQDGRRIAPLNTRAPSDTGQICSLANFYCPPNGVFYVSRGKAAVLSTSAFARLKLAPSAIRLATQSGPMLLSAGKLARDFPPTWRKEIPRNAVCVQPDGDVMFALGEQQTHRSFAESLRDRLGCRDALYLDGAISALFIGGGRPPALFDYAAILYLSK
jgi:uncharacterized protein YigE (DUF2233 family)